MFFLQKKVVTPRIFFRNLANMSIVATKLDIPYCPPNYRYLSKRYWSCKLFFPPLKVVSATFLLVCLVCPNTTYVWMKKWKSLPPKEIICWTRKQNWYVNADTKTNTRFLSMTQRTDVSCIVRNHYILTFCLLIIYSWRL